jgi:hypothetical protein
MAALAVEVLEEWREAERVLRLLPPDAAERDAIAAAIEEMRELYQHVTGGAIHDTGFALVETAARIEETRQLLSEARARSG